MNWVKWFFQNIFNPRLGWWALPVIGSMTALVNISHGWEESLRAGLVAGVTGVAITGTMTGVIQWFAAWENRLWSYTLGTAIPTLTTFSWHFAGQFFNETPELFWSVIAPTVLTFTTSVVLNYGTYYFKTHTGPFGLFARIMKYVCKVPGDNRL
ncbi:hypothetical protein C0581_02140 [Candidatus Parcubacteria bacterium]|nr:MAG: hypothetical protein C0581_02140 [Candidatus Parcubacteria bacterium]